MKKLITAILVTILPIIIFNTKSADSQNTDTKVIKFMYSRDHAADYGEKMFWAYEDEHAYMYQHAIDIRARVSNLLKSNSKSFKDHNYCFLIPNSKGNDTVYADFSLKAWIIKKDGKSEYYYDEEGNLARDLRANYSFFKDCW
ncbi:hypothetical protein [Chryseobacterium sp. MFBS3-17]|uniref:hypothetical protein n=1 Tax=Chryseobacterium sp. MFBS3-17 TaxID=2886689 RepID=UPI001D0E948A|nr:hypothetical protein [Chryseobacterium sp. MFBS3-17]MCC2591110.1 hypothetical protein [Chryseobacterium sp. MFBS3-17]